MSTQQITCQAIYHETCSNEIDERNRIDGCGICCCEGYGCCGIVYFEICFEACK